MAATTCVCSIAHVASRLGEDPELLEAIVSNDDNLTYGNIVSVHVGHDDYLTALTDDGIDEIRDMLASARVSIVTARLLPRPFFLDARDDVGVGDEVFEEVVPVLR